MFDKIVAAYKDGRFEEAVRLFERVNPRKIASAETLYLIAAQSYFKTGNEAKAADCYMAAGDAGKPSKVAFYELAYELFRKAELHAKGVKAAQKLLALNPAHQAASIYYRYYLHYLVMLDELEIANARALEGIKRDDPDAIRCELLLNHIAWCGDEAVNAKITTMSNASPYLPEARAARRNRPHTFGDRIRIGYLTCDLSSQHATVILMRGICDYHDESRFDIRFYCYTPEALIAADDGFRAGLGRKIVPIGHLSDEAAAALIRAEDLDILVDLKGHTQGSRIDLVNLGLAPLQVAWLGYPGSATGIDCDYIIGDAIVTPDRAKPHYHEKIVRLPECYQSNDINHRPLPPATGRSALGLPEDKVVLASFNTIRKLSPENFRAWVKVLKGAPEAVLWIMCPQGEARDNLIGYFAREGIQAKRIIFAESAGYRDHLARIQAADLGLDMFPCNGHTTTSDELWAGLPVVTVKGNSFSSRVSESLLRTLGVPKVVAEDVDGYVELTVALAKDPTRLAELRQRIADNRFKAPLFDTERFTRHLEQAYEMMVERLKAGLEPGHMDVAPLPPRLGGFGPLRPAH